MSETIVQFPPIGFGRGAVVREGVDGKNAIVVRTLGETTAIIRCETDDGGTLRLREAKTSDLIQVLPAQHAGDAGSHIADLQRCFDMMWDADMHGVKQWQEATGKTLTLPDRASLVMWALDQHDAAEERGRVAEREAIAQWFEALAPATSGADYGLASEDERAAARESERRCYGYAAAIRARTIQEPPPHVPKSAGACPDCGSTNTRLTGGGAFCDACGFDAMPPDEEGF